ncbi:MAG: T9SS type A sorting domain-containing protein [Chitinophagaceae bacterium]|nr:MAG: T9SS type A sorting domain-containing protein [Chitinophagaceae bacterium]
MKKVLLTFLVLLSVAAGHAQTTYYWVGGTAASNSNINTGANWNTDIGGTGATRPSSTGATDILVFDGSNIGGTTPNTGQDTVNLNAGITCAQIRFVNGANIVFVRPTSGTSTVTVNGAAGEDFLVEAGCTVLLNSSVGSTVFALAATCTGRVSGSFGMVTSAQARVANTSAGTPGSFVFTAGSTFRSGITGSSSYPFGNNTQSSEQWVVFEPGARLLYEGGNSPMGSSGTYMPVEFRPGSYFHMKASNPVGSGGSFFSRKAFGNMIVEDGATLTADGSINRIDTLVIAPAGAFVAHASGQTVVLGDLQVNGVYSAPAGSTNELTLAGSVGQTVSGAGTISTPSLVVGAGATVTVATNMAVQNAAQVYGKIDFGTSQLSGAATFTAHGAIAPVAGSGSSTALSYIIKGVSGATGIARGLSISGPGIPPGTHVVSFNAALDTIYISRPASTTATGSALSFGSGAATLATAHPGGFGASGSLATSGTRNFESGISYIINGGTSEPFGISTVAPASVQVKDASINAAITTNASADISGALIVNSGKVTIRPGDVLRLLSGAALNGTFDAGRYFVTAADATTGAQGLLRRDGISGTTVFPVGSATQYLPVTLNPATASDFTVASFEGITANGAPNGTPLTATERQTVVNAVWNIDRISGSGAAGVQLHWTNALEGSVFTTFANSEIGFISNNGSAWSAPNDTGDNTSNTIDSIFTTFGALSVGARPPANPFLFNPIPDKQYGTADFTAGVLSSNTSTPIVYTSSNASVATIVNGLVHITGVGSTTIRATQASDGFYPAADVAQTLTVLKAPLTIRANDITRPEGDPNPPLTATYSGFVNGETANVLTTAPTLATAATATSPTGTYPITVSGATATNYEISFMNGTLTVSPRSPQTITFNAPAAKTYGAADFPSGASSTNPGIPVVLTSSNPAVATIRPGNIIHIVGAGTTDITASQAGNDFFFPATSVTRTLTVSKVNLNVRSFDTSKIQGAVNPEFRTSITGFVNGETIASLPTAPVARTTATTTSAPGYYPITFDPGVSSNYNFVYTEGRLMVLPATGTSEDHLQVYQVAPDRLRVRVFSSKPDLADIHIYDISGRPLVTRNVFLPNGGFITSEFVVNGLSAGIYIVRVVGRTAVLTRSFQVLR